MDHTTLSKSVGPTKLDNVGREERVVNGPLKNRSLGKFEFCPSLGISAQPTSGSRNLRFCVCRSHICFSIKSLVTLFVSGSDFKMPVSASWRVSDLPFATPTRLI